MALLERHSRTVLLVKWAGFWSPLAVRVGDGSSYVDAASAIVRAKLGDVPFRYGAVVGHLSASGPQSESGTRVERRLLLVIPPEPLSSVTVERLADHSPLPVRWWTPGQLRKAEVSVFPPELPEVVDGYWDGWLPDGPLSLDPV
ncbi:hypothetical protein [Streptomyces sp. NBC_01477]|uniref:hypothetical protein n=1 Tax=Streptomyces sp. NBC_01477 TaxID=2976015 RepID=UPI002E2F380B|nr:hypothetical protein [Streptomyces sp. NBC_01477]